MAYTIDGVGPTAVRTFTFPDADATILTTNAAVTAAQGGTGTASYAVGDLLYASGATAISKLVVGVTAGMFVRSTATLPAWSTLILPNSATAGDIFIATGANTMGSLTTPAAGQVMVSGAAPAWSASPALTSVILGTLPSTDTAAGSVIRIPSGGYISAQNAANTANAIIAGTDANNNTLVGFNAVSLAQNAVRLVRTGGYGLLVVVNTSAARSALFCLTAGGASTELLDPGTAFSATKDNGTTINVYYDTDGYYVQNKTAGAASIGTILLGKN